MRLQVWAAFAILLSSAHAASSQGIDTYGGLETVRGYCRSGGTCVAPYQRTKRNGIEEDNLSYDDRDLPRAYSPPPRPLGPAAGDLHRYGLPRVYVPGDETIDLKIGQPAAHCANIPLNYPNWHDNEALVKLMAECGLAPRRVTEKPRAAKMRSANRPAAPQTSLAPDTTPSRGPSARRF